MSGDAFRDGLTLVLLFVGAIMSLAAGVGMVRFPDLLTRMHPATKPQILGVISTVVAVCIQNPMLGVVAPILLIVTFQMFTAPIASHMVGRAEYRGDRPSRDPLVVDELADEVALADRRERRLGELAEAEAAERSSEEDGARDDDGARGGDGARKS